MRALSVGFAVIAFAVISAAERVVQLPDVRTGVIDGRIAAMVWPARYASDTSGAEPLDPQGCTAHFVSASDPDREDLHPCGQWLRPRPDKYKVWLELRASISPFLSILGYGDVPGDRGMLIMVPVVPAGSVHVNAGKQNDSVSLRVLSLNTHYLNHLQRAFDRRLKRGEVNALMPLGKGVAGLFDRSTGDAIALSEPFEVKADRSDQVIPRAPKSGSDVLVILQRTALGKEGDVKLFLSDARSRREPDVFVPAVDAVYAIWYGATGKSAQLTASSATLSLPPVTLALRQQRPTTYRGRLELLPKLSVSVVGPQSALQDAEIVIERRERGEPVCRMRVEGREKVETQPLPRERLDVTLTIKDWEFRQQADLRQGSDQLMVFTLDPINVRGTVYWGDARAPAKIAFTIGERKTVSFESNEDGETRLFFGSPRSIPSS